MKQKQKNNIKMIEIPKEVYRKLDFLCSINKWDTDKHIITILKREIHSAEILDENGKKQVINF
jgi:hypothetical protein